MKTQCSRHSLINFKKQSGFPTGATVSLDTAIGEGGLGHSAGQADTGGHWPLAYGSSAPPSLHTVLQISHPTSTPALCLRPMLPWLLCILRAHGCGLRGQTRTLPSTLFTGSPGLFQQERQVTRWLGRGCGTTWQRGPGWDPTEGKEEKQWRH